MKNENIAKDLLYLYSEDLLSDDSKKFVEESLEESKDLRKDLELIKKEAFNQEKLENEDLSFLTKKIKEDKKTFVLMVISFSISLLLIILAFLQSPIHYENDGALYEVTQANDSIFLSFNKKIIKADVYETSAEDGKTKSLFIDAYTTRLDKLLNKESYQSIKIKKDDYDSIFYDNQEKKASLIYGNDENVYLLPRLILSSYLIILLIISLLLDILMIFVKKIRKFFKYINLILPSYFLSVLLVNGFNFHSFYLEKKFFYIIGTGIFIYIFLLSLVNLLFYKKRQAL